MSNEFIHSVLYIKNSTSSVCSWSIPSLFGFHGNFSQYNSNEIWEIAQAKHERFLIHRIPLAIYFPQTFPLVNSNECEISYLEFQSRVPDGDPRVHSGEKFSKSAKSNDALRGEKEGEKKEIKNLQLHEKSTVYNCMENYISKC